MWAAAWANGIVGVGSDGAEHFTLHAAASLFNHSCSPNAVLHIGAMAVESGGRASVATPDKATSNDSTTSTKQPRHLERASSVVIAIAPIAAGEAITICYLGPVPLCVLNRELRRAFITNRFGFDCDCERCTLSSAPSLTPSLAALSLATPSHSLSLSLATPSDALSPDALLEVLAAPYAADADHVAAAALHAHRQLVQPVKGEDGRMIGLELKPLGSPAETCAATDDFMELAPTLGLSHWMRHGVRASRCAALLRLPKKEMAALMLIGEHLTAEGDLLPRGHTARLATLADFEAALDAVPQPLRPRVLAKLYVSFPNLEAEVAYLQGEVRGWLRTCHQR